MSGFQIDSHHATFGKAAERQWYPLSRKRRLGLPAFASLPQRCSHRVRTQSWRHQTPQRAARGHSKAGTRSCPGCPVRAGLLAPCSWAEKGSCPLGPTPGQERRPCGAPTATLPARSLLDVWPRSSNTQHPRSSTLERYIVRQETRTQRLD